MLEHYYEGLWLSVVSYVGKIDPKGRVTIPLAIRDLLGLYEGVSVTIQADLDARSIVIKPYQAPGVLIKISVDCDSRSCIADMISWVEKVEGFRDILEVRCYRGERGYRCYSIASISPKGVDKITDSGKYRVEVLS
jgi:AbrB family looped-hinge helix DNA binding protein